MKVRSYHENTTYRESPYFPYNDLEGTNRESQKKDSAT